MRAAECKRCCDGLVQGLSNKFVHVVLCGKRADAFGAFEKCCDGLSKARATSSPLTWGATQKGDLVEGVKHPSLFAGQVMSHQYLLFTVYMPFFCMSSYLRT